MSTFPALVPSTRTFTPGDVPSAIQGSLSGVLTGFRRGNRRIKQTLSLSFVRLQESDITLIRNHYDNRDGSFNIFFLSSEVWSGYTTPPIPLLSDYAWRYVAPPVITDGSCGFWDVEIELETVPIDTGDLIFDAELAPASPARTYILDAGSASASPARDYIISPPGAA
jgi:hypothetical protein